MKLEEINQAITTDNEKLKKEINLYKKLNKTSDSPSKI